MSGGVVNDQYLSRLVEIMYKIDDFPYLDEYFSRMLGRPILRSWRLFRNITKNSTKSVWGWSREQEVATYPSTEVPTFEDFVTIMLHEVAHGWCHFNKDCPDSEIYLDNLNEEQVCWSVSEIICKRLKIHYQRELEDLCYQFHIACKNSNNEEIDKITDELPAHLRP